jgi:antirestriction protein ArdC
MKNASSKCSVSDLITQIIIEKLEAGCVPWHRPWNSSADLPRNIVSGKAYRGINAFLLGCTGSTWFATYKQIQERGGHVNVGAKSIPVVFWTLKSVDDRDTGNEKSIPILRYYRVFSLDDVSGVPIPAPTATIRPFSPIKAAERIVEDMPLRPEIKTGQPRAYYSPSLDYINMPRHELFLSDEAWYSTLFHELGHATGHENRLNRSTVTKSSYFGGSDYSKEELVAECCAAFLSAEAGISNAVIDNSAAYIDGWLKALKSKDNRGLVVQAAAAGQKAADFILNRRAPECCVEA